MEVGRDGAAASGGNGNGSTGEHLQSGATQQQQQQQFYHNHQQQQQQQELQQQQHELQLRRDANGNFPEESHFADDPSGLDRDHSMHDLEPSEADDVHQAKEEPELAASSAIGEKPGKATTAAAAAVAGVSTAAAAGPVPTTQQQFSVNAGAAVVTGPITGSNSYAPLAPLVLPSTTTTNPKSTAAPSGPSPSPRRLLTSLSTGAAAAGGAGGLKGSLGSSNSSSTAAAGVQRGVRVGLQLFAQQVKARTVNGQAPQQQQGFSGGDAMEVSASGLYGDLPLPKQASL